MDETSEKIIELVKVLVQDVRQKEVMSNAQVKRLLGLEEDRKGDFYLFIAGGVQEQEVLLGRGLKWHARFASHKIPGCDDQIGPNIKYTMSFKTGLREYENRLTRRQLVFGVGGTRDKGFKGLCDWDIEDFDKVSVKVDLIRASTVSATEWIVPFVRDIILAAGWKVEHEHFFIPSAPSLDINIF